MPALLEAIGSGILEVDVEGKHTEGKDVDLEEAQEMAGAEDKRAVYHDLAQVVGVSGVLEEPCRDKTFINIDLPFFFWRVLYFW